MKEKILEIISQVTSLDIKDLKKNLEKENLWDSFTHIELIVNLESEFNISFEQDEIAALTTPQKVIDLVLKKVA